MTLRKIGLKEADDLFLDIWYQYLPETYEELWCPGIEAEWLISDCAEVFPKLYMKLLNMWEEELRSRGLTC